MTPRLRAISKRHAQMLFDAYTGKPGETACRYDSVTIAHLRDIAWVLERVERLERLRAAAEAFIDRTQDVSKVTGENAMKAPTEYVALLKACVESRKELEGLDER